MADKKISALTAATTPLAGTEVLPIVQSSSTVKVSVSNLTAGRAVSASSVTTTGEVSTSGALRVAGSYSTNYCQSNNLYVRYYDATYRWVKKS